MKFSQITFANIKTQIESFLRAEYKKSNVTFSPASPFGMILTVLEELFQLSFVYQKRSLDQFDLSNPKSLNEKIIKSSAIVAGHIPYRAISATGTLRFRLKVSTNITTDIPGGKITIADKTALRNITNGLEYYIDLGGSDNISFQASNGLEFQVNIIQGKYTTAQLTGDGRINQSYTINAPGGKSIENFNVKVTLNGQVLSIKKHLYEMLPNEPACVVRTSYTGTGIDVIFGNNGYGIIPPVASIIEVFYTESDGDSGSLFTRKVNDFRVIGDILDGFGQTLNVSNVFDIFTATNIDFGANSESISFTKNILPLTTTNFVLALPEQYAYTIKKLGVFSHVNAYFTNGVINIIATPNIKRFKNRNQNYFNVSLQAFQLNNTEKKKIESYLKAGGNIQLSQKFRIVSPKLSYYVMNVYYISYADSVDEVVNQQIYDVISEYFLNLTRLDRLPKSDIIEKILEIPDIDSVDIDFISKNTEDYHREFTIQQNNLNQNLFNNPNTVNTVLQPAGYEPNRVIGLDPVLGDILFESNELPILRGGWYDRNGVFYNDGIDLPGANTVNLYKQGTTQRKTIIGV